MFEKAKFLLLIYYYQTFFMSKQSLFVKNVKQLHFGLTLNLIT